MHRTRALMTLAAALACLPWVLLARVEAQSATRERVMSLQVVEALPAGGGNCQTPTAATYFLDRTQSIEGDLLHITFRAQRSIVQIEVKRSPQASSERWSVEWGAGLQLNRQGVTREALKPGDRVVVTGHPARNPEVHRLLMRTISRPRDGWKWGGSGGSGCNLGVLVPAVAGVRFR